MTSSTRSIASWQAAHVPVQREDGAGSGQNGAAGGLQRETDESGTAQHDVRVSLRRNLNNAAAAAIRPGNIQVRVAVKSQSLRTAESAEENTDVAALRDAMHAVKTGCGRARHVQIAARMKCQVVCRDRRLHGREHKNLAARADFENRAAAVSDEKIAGLIECNARRDAHSFHPLLGAAVRRNAVDGAVVAAGNEKISFAIESQAAGIHQ